MEMNVKLQAFEGPLDLLLHLIEKNKVDIYDIPIAEITNQYMEYLNAMKEANLDIMSEFLVMAATLLAIKSKMLLPPEETEEDEDEGDPRAELVAQLLEYKIYKAMSQQLKDRQLDAGQIFYKEPTIPEEVAKYELPVDLEELLSDLDLNRLNEIFQSVMKRKEDRVDPIRSKFRSIEKEEVSLEDKMVYLSDYARRNKHFSFRQMLQKSGSRTEVVVTFLAILEMMKAGTIRISQETTFGDIEIESQVAA